MGELWPSEDMLREWAGERAFDRGEGYFLDGRVQVQRTPNGTITGEARGTHVYELWLRRRDGVWDWHCDCPAADGGNFCKHLVAAVMAAANAAVDGVDEEISSARGPSVEPRPDELLDFLRGQSVEQLAGWLHDLASEDRDIEKRLMLYRAAEQPGALKAALGKLLNTGGFLDYRRSMRYADRLDAGIDQLRKVLARDPDECRGLCEYALKRLFKVYVNADDSAGAIGECLHEIAELHVRACKAARPGKVLAKPLYDLKCIDGWRLLPLRPYWRALGAAGQADYSKRVMLDFERLPPIVAEIERYGEAFGVVHRAEELARCTRDFELLQRVLRRDLSHAWDHLRVLESLREFGRGREALAWAESAVKRFPKDDRLRMALAGCLAEAGMRDEALEQCWGCFAERPGYDYWDALKQMAGKDWPVWRVRALEHVAARENGVVSTRIQLLLHDGDRDAAVGLARAGEVAVPLLLELAGAVKLTDPDTAGSFYLRAARAQVKQLQTGGGYRELVDCLKIAATLLPPGTLNPLVAELRDKHGRKPKLMGMLGKAGL